MSKFWYIYGGFVGGFIVGSLAYRAYIKDVFEDSDEERKRIWTAAGIVHERIGNGTIRNTDDAMTDFEFERIRLAEKL